MITLKPGNAQIQNFTGPILELPDFTVITGLNGSGKTRFLKAIDSQAIQFTEYDCDPKLKAILSDPETGPRRAEIVMEARSVFINYIDNISLIKLVENFSQKQSPKGSRRYISAPIGPYFLEILHEYHVALGQNAIKLGRAAQGESDNGALNHDDFVTRFGEYPLDGINEALDIVEFGHEFKFNIPRFERGSRIPDLVNKESGESVGLDGLSNGQKIILSLIGATYIADSVHGKRIGQKLIMLDEVDASFHPSMSQTYIDIIEDVLIEKFGAKVIVVTHSPSTVALAPDEAIHVMGKKEPMIGKTSKSEALRTLCSGVPTLSIDFEGRRQIFCENQDDAKVLSTVYELLSDSLKSPRSLTFLALGFDTSKGGTGHGKSQVIKRVKDLENGGNKSVLGVVDWDGKTTEGNRVFSLGKDERKALENCILDPLLIAAYFAGLKQHSRDKIGFPKGATTASFANLDPKMLQEKCDFVVEMILGSEEELRSDLVDVTYAGGLKLKIPKSYLMHPEHDLMAKAIENIPEFRINEFKKNSHTNPLLIMMHLCSVTMREFPDFIPLAFIDVFNDMLDHDFV